jgi:hypothetical protein
MPCPEDGRRTVRSLDRRVGRRRHHSGAADCPARRGHVRTVGQELHRNDAWREGGCTTSGRAGAACPRRHRHIGRARRAEELGGAGHRDRARRRGRCCSTVRPGLVGPAPVAGFCAGRPSARPGAPAAHRLLAGPVGATAAGVSRQGLPLAAQGMTDGEAFSLLRSGAMPSRLPRAGMARAVVDAATWVEIVNRAGQLRRLSQRFICVAAHRLARIDPPAARARDPGRVGPPAIDRGRVQRLVKLGLMTRLGLAAADPAETLEAAWCSS